MSYEPLKRSCCHAGCINPKLPFAFKLDLVNAGFSTSWSDFEQVWRLPFLDQVYNPPYLTCYWQVLQEQLPTGIQSIGIYRSYAGATQEDVQWWINLRKVPNEMFFARSWGSGLLPCQVVDEVYYHSTVGPGGIAHPDWLNFEPWTFADG